MKLVIDTNVLFSFFKSDSSTRKLIIENSLDLYAPEKTFIELKKYKKLICEKSAIDIKSFDEIIRKMKLFIKIVPKSKFKNFYEEARSFLPDNAKDDAPFVGLALHLDIPLWSNDKLLKKQNRVIVFSTHEMLEILFVNI